ncbi:MAG: ABC transporter substrate-binding protein [Epulopiscium sp. Nuni2H_MBin001]|nr:MAG: ABC transporter substrate-binding protein [Epulopiscium sp. Nuni2H_MBin001]
MKKCISVLTIMAFSVVVGCSSDSTSEASTNDVETLGSIAVIRNLSSDDHTTQFLAGVVAEGTALGYSVDTFISNGDDARFQELVEQQIEKGYDGLIISHGKAEYSTQMLEPALEKGIMVVTFDTAFQDDIVPEGITSTAQDDEALARLSLEEIVATSENSPATVLKLWFGPGIPPLDSREIVYKEYEQAGLIETLELIGPSTLDNVQGDIADRVGAVLPKYQVGSVDAMWGSWDEMAKGGYTALKEANRTDINLVSIDVSNQDINLMMEEGSVWTATAAVDPELIGVISTRILVQKLHGEEMPQTYNFEAQLIRSADLNDDTTMSTLAEVVPGWGQSDAFNELWMDELRDTYAK